MIILTCANQDIAKNDQGEIYKKFSFRNVIQKTMLQAQQCDYQVVVYDLGTLGFGIPYKIEDESFLEKGYYEKEVKKGYKSKSLFKPDIVKSCMDEHKNHLVVYLDGDAQLCDCIDEVDSDDYDIGVTLRDSAEINSTWHQDHVDIVRYVNAGVIFFRPTEIARNFVNDWSALTQSVGNDQMALNILTCPDAYPEEDSVSIINGVRIKYFPCRKFNYYYFRQKLNRNIKIMHFKGDVRNFYPFDRWKRSYCLIVVPIFVKISFLKKIILKHFHKLCGD